MRNPNYRSEIQTYRAIAVIAVVLYHATEFLPGGFLGVDVFFVISGYVICQLVIREIRNDIDHRFRLGEFYFRRFKRLAPPLSATIIVSLILSLFLISPIGPLLVSAKTGLAALAFSSNVFIGIESGDYFAVGASQNIFLHTWSLAVEEQFYIAFAICAFLFMLGLKHTPLKIKTLKILILIITILAIAVSFAYGIMIAWNVRTKILPSSLFGWYLPALSFYNPISRAWEILAGCLLGYTTSQYGFPPKRITKKLLILGILLVLTSFVGLFPISNAPNLYTLVPVIGTILLLMSPIEDARKSKLSTFNGLLVFVGDRSYGLYLIHFPIFTFGSYVGSGIIFNLVLALFSLALADQLHKRVEVPLKNKTYDTDLDQILFIAKTLVPVFFVIGAVVFIDGKNLFSTSVKNLKSAVQQEHITQGNNCSNTNPIFFGASKRCVFNGSTQEREIVYLVGDSNADHLAEAVIGAATNLSMTVNTSIKAGCSFVFPAEGDCKDFVYETFRYLNNAKVGTLLVSLSESAWERGVPKKLGSGTDAFTNQLIQLKQKGFHVLFIKPIPKFFRDSETPSSLNCSTLQIILGDCPRAVHINLEEIDNYRRLALMGMSSLSLSIQMEIVDLDHFFCMKSECVNIINGVLLFRDNAHITVDTSKKMIAELARYLDHDQ